MHDRKVTDYVRGCVRGNNDLIVVCLKFNLLPIQTREECEEILAEC